MSDDFAYTAEGLDAPADNAVAVTPNDSTDLDNVPRALYVGTGGSLVVHMKNGSGAAASVTFANVPVGLLPIRPTRVLASGTAASNIVAVW